ncbi:MAG TPA: nucleotidyl transferase AbiEii/AbiGii toxin family protein [Pyrinomonadaceae bacterium]|nr:nucleotidyl transferase AbiEii/AbiGii toxin family protein [Pyrinomonadaceae bacterium]
MSSADLPTRIFGALATLSKWLDTEKIPHAIIGGIAVSLLTEPRATQDIDVTIWAEEVQIEDLLASATSVGLISRIDNPLELATQARILLLKHVETNVNIDLSLGALPFEKEMIDHSEVITFGSIRLPVARPEDLIISKAVPMRPQDLADIDKLLSFYPDVNFTRIRKLVGEFQQLLDRPEYLLKLEELLERHPQR